MIEVQGKYNLAKIFTDNIEGITLGPILPNGNRSVILVSDNNFSPTQQSQFMLLELITDKKTDK